MAQRKEEVARIPQLRVADLTSEERQLAVRLTAIIAAMGSGTLTLKLHEGKVTQLEAAERFMLGRNDET